MTTKHHQELRCVNPSCDYDMRDDEETQNAVFNYLDDLAADVLDGQVRHVSVSVHRGEDR